jgi:NadR type nicotinamide-nucleotide adenylyltransferase
MAQILQKPTRMIRIGVTGPESCGKSTMAELLASKLSCPFVSEYARNYLSQLNRSYRQEDLDEILKGQLEQWDALSEEPLVIYDTEILVLKIWSEFKFGSCTELIMNEWSKQTIDLYLLCAPDIPYEEDALRENPNDRETLFELYENELKQINANYIIIEGDRAIQLEEITSLIKEKICS